MSYIEFGKLCVFDLQVQGLINLFLEALSLQIDKFDSSISEQRRRKNDARSEWIHSEEGRSRIGTDFSISGGCINVPSLQPDDESDHNIAGSTIDILDMEDTASQIEPFGRMESMSYDSCRNKDRIDDDEAPQIAARQEGTPELLFNYCFIDDVRIY